MNETPQHCPKCRSSMEQGFVLDNSYGEHIVSHWVSGAPLKSFWTGTKVSKDKVVPIGSFRCTSCGYLEFYARPDFASR